MKYVFIENPIAGNKDKQLLFREVQSAFRFLDDEMIIEETTHKGHAAEISKSYAEKYGKDCVIVSCGGDGTVHEIANGLAHTDTPLMILPLGTANDFAKKVYGTKKLDYQSIVKAFGLHNGKIEYDVRPIDLIDYNGEKCINVMSFGLDTKVETIGRKIAGKIPFLGSQAYSIAVVPVMLQPMRYQIGFDINCLDKNHNPYKFEGNPQEYALFAICNASYYGGGFCPAPNSKLDDGILDYALVDAITIPKAIPLIPKYAAGKAEGTSPLYHTGYITDGKVWSVDGKPLLGNCDGENFDYDELKFFVDKKSLNLCFIKE